LNRSERSKEKAINVDETTRISTTATTLNIKVKKKRKERKKKREILELGHLNCPCLTWVINSALIIL